MMSANLDARHKVVYWHRDLPPLSADVVGEDAVEALYGRFQYVLYREPAPDSQLS